jgi:hypothetical protein
MVVNNNSNNSNSNSNSNNNTIKTTNTTQTFGWGDRRGMLCGLVLNILGRGGGGHQIGRKDNEIVTFLSLNSVAFVVVVCVCLWLFAVVCGCLCLFVVVCGCLWLFVVVLVLAGVLGYVLVKLMVSMAFVMPEPHCSKLFQTILRNIYSLRFGSEASKLRETCPGYLSKRSEDI